MPAGTKWDLSQRGGVERTAVAVEIVLSQLPSGVTVWEVEV